MIIVVMGVSGCGKSTVASHLALLLDVSFVDADDLHPEKNKLKMSAGNALTDEDRAPWLESVRDYAKRFVQREEHCVIACSALKKRYRRTLNDATQVCYVFLDGKKELIQQRIHNRHGHFMPEALLDSQFAALESPEHDERVVYVDITPEPEAIARTAMEKLKQASWYQQLEPAL
ncbi:MAG: gluconokinase [Gammaproteobacteria bacterium]|nr:gluconokinase [Gammaproteobacteria bacterium]